MPTDPHDQAAVSPSAGAHADQPVVSGYADDPEMSELVEMFVGELSGRMNAIEQALEQLDLRTLAMLSHQLMGTAGGYGFEPITDSSHVVEQQAKTQADLQTLRQSVGQLVDLCNRAIVSHKVQQ